MGRTEGCDSFPCRVPQGFKPPQGFRSFGVGDGDRPGLLEAIWPRVCRPPLLRASPGCSGPIVPCGVWLQPLLDGTVAPPRVSRWLLDLWVSPAFVAALCLGTVCVSGASAPRQPTCTVVRVLAELGALAGGADQRREVIQGPGPGLFSVEARWHVGLWMRPPPGRLFPGVVCVPFHGFSLLPGQTRSVSKQRGE